jgi:serine protease AprX
MPRAEDGNIAMTMLNRARRPVLAATVLGILLVPVWLTLRQGEPATSVAPEVPAAQQVPAAVVPLATRTGAPAAPVPHVGERSPYIVQAATVDIARSAVLQVGGVITGDLGIIRAVGASLDEWEIAALRAGDIPALRIFADTPVKASSIMGTLPETYYPTEVAATELQVGGITGSGVTVAILDSGLWTQHGPLQTAANGNSNRILAQYDVILAQADPGAYQSPLFETYSANIGDPYGHGTHVTSIIGSAGMSTAGNYQGVAPGVNLVSVRVLDSAGEGTYFNVIRGIQWVVNEKLRYNIRVINLSLGAPPQSPYWDDPLDQAVMAAWASGIVVVAAAGNSGPAPMTIGVPGNTPYIITVGAVTDNYKPLQVSQYSLASFSSAGPTYEGFVKPDVVGMGGHIVAYSPSNGSLALEFPQWYNTEYDELTMSGTSQATAVVSGVVALMLEVSPLLTPDEVKCRLMSGAHPAVTANGTLAYTVFQQGAGLVNAHDATYSTASGCANVGLNVALDMAGLQHYGGRANRNSAGDYYIMEVGPASGPTTGSLLSSIVSPLGLGGLIPVVQSVPLVGSLLLDIPLPGDGLTWNGSYPSDTPYSWSGGYTWSNGYTWGFGYTYSNSYAWDDGYTWSFGYTGSGGNAGVVVPQQQ